jgi:uncharacterized protein YoxC
VIIGRIVSNMSSLQEEVFEGNTTLWDVLNAQGIPELAEETRRLKNQLDTLAVTVQNYQNNTNAEIVRLTTTVNELDNKTESLILDINSLKSSNLSLQTSVDSLNLSVETLNSEVGSFNGLIQQISTLYSTLSSEVTSLRNQVNNLERFSGGIVRYGVQYNVIEWPRQGGTFQAYELNVTGSGDFVPINRIVSTLRQGDTLRRSCVFGIANPNVNPDVNGAIAPLLEGEAEADWGQGIRLIYITRKQ